MASIINRDGRWRALVRRKGFPAQCKTFDTKAAAQAWARRVEAAMDAGAPVVEIADTTIGDVIRAYRKLRGEARPIRDDSNEHYMLKALERGLGHVRLSAATPQDLIGYATMRREEGAGPYTINMDVSKLGTALRYGGAALKITPPDITGAARPLLSHLRLIGGGGRRERLPTSDEFERLIAYMTKEHGARYADALLFAGITAMRRGEVCALRRQDLDEATRCASVMRKHPRKGKTLERVPLLGDSWKIAMRQEPAEDGRIFPMDPGTLSKYFTWACRELGIPDLHLHDLRHHGATEMFRDGFSIEQVALVTGHRSWNQLRRYTNLKPEDLARRAAPSDPGAQQRPGSRHTDAPPLGTSGPEKSQN